MMSSSQDQSAEQCATTYVFPTPDPLQGESESESQRRGAMSSESQKGSGGVAGEQSGKKAPVRKTSSAGLGTPPSAVNAGDKQQQTCRNCCGDVKPGPSSSSGAHGMSTRKDSAGCPIVAGCSNCSNWSAVGVAHKPRPKSALKGHARSASHGGVIQPYRGQEAGGSDGQPTKASVLSRGHTRAASHGQIVEDPVTMKAHSRAPSKTDFILPPGHKERERVNSLPVAKEHGRGHSRQASRSESVYTVRQTKVSMKQKLMFWKRSETDHLKVRVVVPNHTVELGVGEPGHPNSSYPNNRIRTTKYTTLSFLPRNLFEQFHRFANLYFISIVLLNWIPIINAFGKEIAMLPVTFVLGVTAIKDLFEDRRRYNSDKRINNSTCRVWHRDVNRFESVKWKDIHVGDIVHLSCNEVIPADVLVLRTSDANGLCYIETMNLDGESNLKQREVVRGFVKKKDNFDIKKFQSKVEIGLPTTKIYHFSGKMIHVDNEQVPLTKENLLLRDCCLKNTDFVEGLVVYAGRETKAMLNNGGPRHKRTGLEKLMNLEVVWCVVILAVLCIVGATGSALWLSNFKDVPFIPTSLSSEDDADILLKVFYTFLTFIIILQVMIPLSLYVTIELTKLMQIYHIQSDIELYDPEVNKRIECRAMNIPEDLGQIQYIFSDKTGTLTENKMVFRRCAIAGKDYGHSEVTDDGIKKAENTTSELEVNPTLSEIFLQRNVEPSVSSAFPGDCATQDAQKVREFFLIMAICNTVVVAKHPHVDMMDGNGDLDEADRVSLDPNLSTLKDSVGLSPGNSLPCSSFNISDSRLSVEYRPELQKCKINEDKVPQKGATSQSPGSNLGRCRPTRLLDLKQSRPLSPISSSNETTPTESPSQRPRHLPFPKLSRLSKTLNISNPHVPVYTPSPCDRKPIFEAESPDELALVEAAYLYNCRLVKRSPKSLVVSMPGENLMEFEILHVFPFDSVRKRMSIVVRHPETNEVVMYCKGADSAILSRLAMNGTTDLLNRTQNQINNYAREGLRTLVMAKRVISESVYKHWLEKFQEAELDMYKRDDLMWECYNVLENNLELIGATGIEDRLQDRVPETIESLRKAGIVVWVLTGDKQETAINIAYSCKLFTPAMDIIKLNAHSKDSAETSILFYLKEVERLRGTNEGKSSVINFANESNRPDSEVESLTSTERALVVDGKTLTYILDQKTQMLDKFLALTKHCSSVLCCRATPLQKAFIVTSVKEELGMRTLAIGDGANDVSMIQRADVGIGISGKEGMQAVMASDFAIAKFKYLERLLLVHGHWCYDRLARMILYFFYKNAAFVFVIFWYQLLNGWSGSVMIDQMYLMVFNLFFTALPPMAIGIYDQDCPADLLLSSSKLYGQGRLQKVHRPHSFWMNMLDALYQSVVIFFMSYGAYSGSDVGMFEFGTTIVVSCMFTMLVHMAIEAKSWTIIHVLSIVLSILVFYGFAFIYNTVCINCLGFENPFWVIHELITSPIHWLIVILTTVLAVLPRLIVRCVENSLYPSDVTKALLVKRQSKVYDEEFFASRSSSSSSILKNRRSLFCFSRRRTEVNGITSNAPSVSATS